MKTVRELIAMGGQWVDVKWRDFIKMQDGSYWRPASGLAQNDDVLMRRVA